MLMISVGSLGAALWLATSASLEDAIARPTIDRGPPQSVDGAKPTQKTGKNRNYSRSDHTMRPMRRYKVNLQARLPKSSHTSSQRKRLKSSVHTHARR